MKKELPIYKMVINEENEDSGVDYIAFVDAPAIKVNWYSFDNKERFKVDSERKIIISPAMIPDIPIYRCNEKMGEFMVVFDKEQINIIQEKFMRNNFINNLNEMHDSEKKIEGVFMKNSFVSDSELGIKAPELFKDLPDGTWFVSYKFTDENQWQEFVKSGNFKGVSVEGNFELEPLSFEAEFLNIINQITHI